MLIKSRILLILGCLFLLPIVSAQTYLPSIQEIVKKDKLVVAINAHDAPPLFWHNEQGQLVGYDIDLAKYLAKNLGVQLEFVRTAQTFDEVVDVVNRGQADIAVSLLTPNLTRARKVTFTEPYVYLNKLFAYNRLAVAQHKLTDPVTQIRNIKGLKIGALEGSSYINDATHYYSDEPLVLFSTAGEALAAVKSGEIFGFFSNSAHLPYWLKKDPSMNLYVGVSSVESKIDPIAIAVSGKYPDLVTWINLALSLRKTAGVGTEFEKEYANTEAK